MSFSNSRHSPLENPIFGSCRARSKNDIVVQILEPQSFLIWTTNYQNFKKSYAERLEWRIDQFTLLWWKSPLEKFTKNICVRHSKEHSVSVLGII